MVQPSAVGGQQTLLNASGYVTARRQATVSSKVTGKVMEVFLEEGKHVEGGQILARIDASNLEKSLHLAEAQLEVSRKALAETQASLDHNQRELARLYIGMSLAPVEAIHRRQVAPVDRHARAPVEPVAL